MEIRTSYAEGQDGICIVEVNGRIAADTITQLEDALTAVLEGGSTRIVVDLGDVGYISSAGLRVFLSTLKSTKANNGVLVLANLNSNVAKVFKLAGFTKIFTIMDDVPKAVQSIRASE